MKIDARNLDCPKPVIETKKTLESMSVGSLGVLVKGTTARENMKRFLTSKGYEYEMHSEGDEYSFVIQKGEASEPVIEKSAEHVAVQGQGASVLVGSKQMGEGSEELGSILMKSFLFTLSEMDDAPKAIAFINSGVYLTCEGSAVLESIKAIEERGTLILSCGTCLDYYGLKDSLKVGSVSNMLTILEKINEGSKILRI